MKNYSVSLVQIEDMKHCVGFDHRMVKRGKYNVWRNYFTTADDDSDWDNLVKQRLATKEDFPHGCGDNPKAYQVSKDGLDFLGRVLSINMIGDGTE
ncbi:hypothetical protein CAFE_18610 [Caprobacter fermentans]|uniref:Uncharacterized protein n=1 Tax=Caproicibacter fermentans TaxID=2576756 RepID=A0A6N8HZY7_9FIRM|nr:hypothetical protein [Caproicibacter fermentans]MVB11155.1 hypothetical protein [Caproicibacter fermentans]